jgi:hypothetical protein
MITGKVDNLRPLEVRFGLVSGSKAFAKQLFMTFFCNLNVSLRRARRVTREITILFHAAHVRTRCKGANHDVTYFKYVLSDKFGSKVSCQTP